MIRSLEVQLSQVRRVVPAHGLPNPQGPGVITLICLQAKAQCSQTSSQADSLKDSKQRLEAENRRLRADKQRLEDRITFLVSRVAQTKDHRVKASVFSGSPPHEAPEDPEAPEAQVRTSSKTFEGCRSSRGPRTSTVPSSRARRDPSREPQEAEGPSQSTRSRPRPQQQHLQNLNAMYERVYGKKAQVAHDTDVDTDKENMSTGPLEDDANQGRR